MNSSFDWGLLPTFLAALDRGSLLGAAKQLGISQPTVSQQMRRLEDEIGRPLFVRETRGVRLTEAGVLPGVLMRNKDLRFVCKMQHLRVERADVRGLAHVAAGQGDDRARHGGREEREIVISEDDVLLPVGGIADIMESYAFIRTGGYLPSPNDVYISLQQVRRFGLRKGDVVTGAVRQPREGERREKFNALVRLDTINGVTPDEARNRVEFSKLVPLYQIGRASCRERVSSPV